MIPAFLGPAAAPVVALVPRIRIGDRVDDFVAFLRRNFNWLFDFIASFFRTLIDNLEDFLQWPPEWVAAVVFGLIAWRLRSAPFAVFTVLSFLLIDGMNLWNQAMSTLSLTLVASFMAVVIGVPVGIAAARLVWLSAGVRLVLDFMQTMPAFVYLLPAVFFFGIGKVPGVVATLVFAMPPAVRLTELGIRQVDREVVEAADAFGSPPRQTLVRVQIPLAIPTIMAGVNQVIMLALSMVVIAGIAGAGGLGAVVFGAITRVNIGLGFEAGLSVVVLAIFLDRVTAGTAEKLSSTDRGRERTAV